MFTLRFLRPPCAAEPSSYFLGSLTPGPYAPGPLFFSVLLQCPTWYWRLRKGVLCEDCPLTQVSSL